jgi:hypothetical protein
VVTEVSKILDPPKLSLKMRTLQISSYVSINKAKQAVKFLSLNKAKK